MSRALSWCRRDGRDAFARSLRLLSRRGPRATFAEVQVRRHFAGMPRASFGYGIPQLEVVGATTPAARTRTPSSGPDVAGKTANAVRLIFLSPEREVSEIDRDLAELLAAQAPLVFNAGKVGATMWLRRGPGGRGEDEVESITALLVGLGGQSGGGGGKEDDIHVLGGKIKSKLTRHQFQKAVKAAHDALKEQKIQNATVEVLAPRPISRTTSSQFTVTPRHISEAFFDAAYQFELLKGKGMSKAAKPTDAPPPSSKLSLEILLTSENDTNCAGAADHMDEDITVTTSPAPTIPFPSAASSSASYGSAVAAGKCYARTLKNLPANLCTTEYLKNELQNLLTHASKCFSNFTVFHQKELEEMGFGCLTAVGRGSASESYLARIECDVPLQRRTSGSCGEVATPSEDQPPPQHETRTPRRPAKTIVLVGKGVVHDSGGLNMKLSGMPGMKMDMGGAAAVLGTLKAVADYTLHMNKMQAQVTAPGNDDVGVHEEIPFLRVVGVLPLVENSVSGSCYRPGDVLQSLNGLTVEVNNTDAEGRLILCDALTWAQKEYREEDVVAAGGAPGQEGTTTFIDIATLTGAMVTALGSDFTGLFSNCSGLRRELECAGGLANSNDRVWQMPLLEAKEVYGELLKSETADVSNIGKSGAAGSITAALFLEKFVEAGRRWAHLDIAGTAMGGSFDKASATGRPVGLLVDYVMREVASASGMEE